MTLSRDKDSLAMIRNARTGIHIVLVLVLAGILFINHEWVLTFIHTLINN